MDIVDGILVNVSENDVIKNHIKIPEGVKVIGEEAFANLTSLSSVDIPSSVTKIEDKAFYGCTNLKSISIPKSVTEIGDFAFSSCTKLASINLSEGLRSIGSDAFFGCTKLKTIFIPNSTENIGMSAFSNCEKLKFVHLPENLTIISSSLFKDCEKLKEINIPSNVQSIGDFAFLNCVKIREINLPNTVIEIGDGTFLNCIKLSKINIPENLTIINKSTFAYCRSLKNLQFPETLKQINDSAFENCRSLGSVIIPESVESIGEKAFFECKNLYDVRIENGVKSIGDFAFEETPINEIYLPKSIILLGEDVFKGCSFLKTATIDSQIGILSSRIFAECSDLRNVTLPESLKTIAAYAFFECPNLKSIKIPNSVENINAGAFYECDTLQDINMPTSLKYIGVEAFNKCFSLTTLSFPASLERIDEGAFTGCKNISEITFSEGLKYIDKFAFFECQSLSDIYLPKSIISVNDSAFSDCENIQNLVVPKDIEYFGDSTISFNYMKRNENGFVFSKDTLPNSVELNNNINLSIFVFASNYNHYDMLMREQKSPAIADFYNFMFLEAGLSKEEKASFIDNHNFTFFKKVMATSDYKSTNIYTFLYNLGAVSVPFKENGKTINYAQKVSEFLIEKINKKDIDLMGLAYLSAGMNNDGFKKDFTDFFLSNFDEFIVQNNKDGEFFAKSYNYFDEIQKTNTSNHGSQRQLKPTIKKFVSYFEDNKFIGTTEENRHIAKTISPFFESQIAFDNAVTIFDEKKENKTPDHILSKPLKETDIFDGIDKYETDILELQKSTLKNLAETAGIEFSYEWLSKNDPTNLILGKLCNCCAHLEGAGYGIMRASIVHPNVQTLVIRDKTGNIIAKSTLYVNPDEGYGVFNNVEVSEQYVNSKDKFALKKIYEKYILGVEAFVEKYNAEHPDKKITQINVGMGFNDLKKEITSNNKWSAKLLQSLDYSKYGYYENGHQGDSNDSQYIIWNSEDNLEK